MSETKVELADIFREYRDQYFASTPGMSVAQKRVYSAICNCRTSALGGRKHRCTDCNSECIVFNACRNRHCPKCQGKARADWTAAREAELLPVPCFHVVFTLPQEMVPLALQNQQEIYGILFRASSQTLRELAADPKHLGAEIGVLSVLHTWGQQLVAHPHTHCIVTGGGISSDGSKWIPCKQSKSSKKDFFIHVDILSAVFRGKFLSMLRQAYKKGDLKFHGKQAHLNRSGQFHDCLRQMPKKWNVYAKRPFGTPKTLIRYLARYTHRVAISNQRIIELKDGEVTFSYKDYADNGQWKTRTLPAITFIRRFLLHVLPSGFMRIRHSGFFGSRFRKQKLELCRKLLGGDDTIESSDDQREAIPIAEAENDELPCCPICKTGKLVVIAEIPHPAFVMIPQDKTASLQRAPPFQLAT